MYFISLMIFSREMAQEYDTIDPIDPRFHALPGVSYP